MTDPLGDAGAMAQAQVKALVQNAQALGLTWTLRPATVTSSSPVMATLDGDTVPIDMTSIVGSVYSGQRVYVLIIPPSGNYVIGFVGDAVGGTVGWTAATGNSAAITVETLVLATGTITFRAGCAYEIDYELDVQGSVGGNFANFQIRKTNVAGTVLRANSGHPMASVAGFGATCKGSAIVRNTSSADIASVVVLTVASPLAGTVTIVGAADRLAFLRARYIGGASIFTSGTVL